MQEELIEQSEREGRADRQGDGSRARPAAEKNTKAPVSCPVHPSLIAADKLKCVAEWCTAWVAHSQRMRCEAR